MNVAEIRAKFPQYADVSDQELVDGFHQKYYSDMPKDQFYQSLGFSPGGGAAPAPAAPNAAAPAPAATEAPPPGPQMAPDETYPGGASKEDIIAGIHDKSVPLYQRAGQTFADELRMEAKGVTGGWNDPINAGLDVGTQWIRNKVGLQDEPAPSYADALKSANQETNAARTRLDAITPYGAEGLQLGGALSVPGGAFKVAKAAKAGKLATTAMVAGEGGLYGGSSAAAEGVKEGKSAGEVGRDALSAAWKGALLSGGLSAAGQGVDKVAKIVKPASKYASDAELIDKANQLRGRARLSKANQKIVDQADKLEDFNIAASKGKQPVGDLASTWERTLQGAKSSGMKAKEFPYSVDEITALNKFANPTSAPLRDKVAALGTSLQGGGKVASLPFHMKTLGIPFGVGTGLRAASTLIPRGDPTKAPRAVIRSFADKGVPDRDTIARLLTQGGLAYNRNRGGP